MRLMACLVVNGHVFVSKSSLDLYTSIIVLTSMEQGNYICVISIQGIHFLHSVFN